MALRLSVTRTAGSALRANSVRIARPFSTTPANYLFGSKKEAAVDPFPNLRVCDIKSIVSIGLEIMIFIALGTGATAYTNSARRKSRR